MRRHLSAAMSVFEIASEGIQSASKIIAHATRTLSTNNCDVRCKIEELRASHQQVNALHRLGHLLSVQVGPLAGRTLPKGEQPPTLCVPCSRLAVGPKFTVATTSENVYINQSPGHGARQPGNFGMC